MKDKMSSKEELIDVLRFRNNYMIMGHTINFDDLCELIVSEEALSNMRSINQKVSITVVNKYMTEKECKEILDKVKNNER